MIYDSLLVTALMFLVTVPFIALQGGESVESNSGLLHVLYQLALFAVVFAFFVGYWTLRGRTLGMQSWGLQLQTPDNQLPSVGAASLRFFAAILSWLPAGLGFLWQLVDRDQLAWHDRLSNTRLVYYPRPGKNDK
jgi:uncharacterized RDD family membrane protein YckC